MYRLLWLLYMDELRSSLRRMCRFVVGIIRTLCRRCTGAVWFLRNELLGWVMTRLVLVRLVLCE